VQRYRAKASGPGVRIQGVAYSGGEVPGAGRRAALDWILEKWAHCSRNWLTASSIVIVAVVIVSWPSWSTPWPNLVFVFCRCSTAHTRDANKFQAATNCRADASCAHSAPTPSNDKYVCAGWLPLKNRLWYGIEIMLKKSSWYSTAGETLGRHGLIPCLRSPQKVRWRRIFRRRRLPLLGLRRRLGRGTEHTTDTSA